MVETRVDKVDWRLRKERNRSKTLPRHLVSLLPFQLGGDGEEFVAELAADMPAGPVLHIFSRLIPDSIARRFGWLLLYRHHLISSSPQGGG
jgi:hypothetical protein